MILSILYHSWHCLTSFRAPRVVHNHHSEILARSGLYIHQFHVFWHVGSFLMGILTEISLGGCGPSWVPAMTPNNARIKKNHSKTVYNGRIVFLSIFRSCADLKSGMSTFCQSPKIYFESKIFIQDFFSETSSISTFECAADHQNRFTGSQTGRVRVRWPPPEPGLSISLFNYLGRILVPVQNVRQRNALANESRSCIVSRAA